MPRVIHHRLWVCACLWAKIHVEGRTRDKRMKRSFLVKKHCERFKRVLMAPWFTAAFSADPIVLIRWRREYGGNRRITPVSVLPSVRPGRQFVWLLCCSAAVSMQPRRVGSAVASNIRVYWGGGMFPAPCACATRTKVHTLLQELPMCLGNSFLSGTFCADVENLHAWCKWWS